MLSVRIRLAFTCRIRYEGFFHYGICSSTKCARFRKREACGGASKWLAFNLTSNFNPPTWNDKDSNHHELEVENTFKLTRQAQARDTIFKSWIDIGSIISGIFSSELTSSRSQRLHSGGCLEAGMVAGVARSGWMLEKQLPIFEPNVADWLWKQPSSFYSLFWEWRRHPKRYSVTPIHPPTPTHTHTAVLCL